MLQQAAAFTGADDTDTDFFSILVSA